MRRNRRTAHWRDRLPAILVLALCPTTQDLLAHYRLSLNLGEFFAFPDSGYLGYSKDTRPYKELLMIIN